MAGETGGGFEDLEAWKLAHQLMLRIHALSRKLPPDEKFDLYHQIRSSSKRVGASIAEGYGRYHYLDSLRFYYMGRGSLDETINHIISARDLKYWTEVESQEQYELAYRTRRTLNGYIAYVKRQRQGHEMYGGKVIKDEHAAYEVAVPSDKAEVDEETRNE